MARLRLIAIAAIPDTGDRILGCYGAPAQAVAAILAKHPAVVPGERLFYEDPDQANPAMIQLRYVANGEAPHLGRVMVDRGNVDTVLAELRAAQIPAAEATAEAAEGAAA